MQIDLLRRAGVARRLALALSMSDEVMALSRRALRRANPGVGAAELDLAMLRLYYGDAVAERVRCAMRA